MQMFIIFHENIAFSTAIFIPYLSPRLYLCPLNILQHEQCIAGIGTYKKWR